MSLLNNILNRIKNAIAPKRKPPVVGALPQGMAVPPVTDSAPGFKASLQVSEARPMPSAVTPEAVLFSAGVSMVGAVPARYPSAGLDAAAINEALCTQCRRFANDIAAQEVL